MYDRTVKFNFGLGPFNLRVDLGFLDLIEPVFRGQKIKTSGAFRDIVFWRFNDLFGTFRRTTRHSWTRGSFIPPMWHNTHAMNSHHMT